MGDSVNLVKIWELPEGAEFRTSLTKRRGRLISKLHKTSYGISETCWVELDKTDLLPATRLAVSPDFLVERVEQ